LVESPVAPFGLPPFGLALAPVARVGCHHTRKQIAVTNRNNSHFAGVGAACPHAAAVEPKGEVLINRLTLRRMRPWRVWELLLRNYSRIEDQRIEFGPDLNVLDGKDDQRNARRSVMPPADPGLYGNLT
jgi:hypothetical protein